ncbi:hypothetical protein BU25DRAFT_316919, partial [Macroventuria anomochaeta]
EQFEVNSNHIYLAGKNLLLACTGYKVRHKKHFKADGSAVKLWLCQRCHLARQLNAAKVVSGTHHITEHMIKVHRIDPATGLLPETPSRPGFSSPFEAAKAAGSSSFISHSP